MPLPRDTTCGKKHVSGSWLSGIWLSLWWPTNQTTEVLNPWLFFIQGSIVRIAIFLCCLGVSKLVPKLWKLFRVSQWSIHRSIHSSIHLILLFYPVFYLIQLYIYLILSICLNLKEDKCIDTWGKDFSPPLTSGFHGYISQIGLVWQDSVGLGEEIGNWCLPSGKQ